MQSPTFLDLFAGAGGLSLGLGTAGWQSLLAIDNWSDAVRTYQKNFGGHAAWECDIALVDAKTLARHLDGDPEWIVGGPPCQGFSTVGKRQRTDPRNKMFIEFKRLVGLLKPSGFVLENVLGLKDMRFVDEVAGVFSELGYTVSFAVLRSADYGVPQLRRRVIFVGHREQGFFRGPLPSRPEGSHVTVWDAIGDLPALGPGQTADTYDKEPFTDYQTAMRMGSSGIQGHTASNHPPHLVRAISYIPDGGNRRDIPDEFQPASGFHNSYSRLYSKAPAVAVTSNMGKPSATRCIHPFQHRGLTAREGARLQGFPDLFHFTGGVVSQRLQVANAVPPILAAAIGSAILDEDRWSDEPIDATASAQLSLLKMDHALEG
jgi:DNA (cytosine-5)-methyltransferase 1